MRVDPSSWPPSNCFVAQYSSRWEASSRPFAGRGKERHIMQSSEQEPLHVAPGEGAMRRVVGDFVTFKMVVELHP